jgi:uncharacterized integral membrane protein (TIGR00698 family)
MLSNLQSEKIVSPLLISILVGVATRNIFGLKMLFESGVQFSIKKILRLSIVLLGLRLSFIQVLDIGFTGIFTLVVSSIGTLFFTFWLGRKLNINSRFSQLIAVGTSICGASAIVAAAPVIESSEEDLTYVVATITSLGTLAMVSYPLLQEFMQLNPSEFGLWCGASIHEVAQVLVASFQVGTFSGETATVAKLSRVLLIIPVLFILSFQNKSHGQNFSLQKIFSFVPWFVCFFVLVTLLNSVNLIPVKVQAFLISTNQFLLCLSMAAVGLGTRLSRITSIGIKPFLLAIVSWLFLSWISLFLIKALAI